MKDNLNTTNKTLLENLLSIFEIPERLNSLDLVRLKELLIYISKDKFNRLKFIYSLVSINENYNYPKQYQPNKHFDYWANKRCNYDKSYFDLIGIETDIKKRIEILKNTSTNITIESDFNKDVFSTIESERFFLYVVNDWIIDKKEPSVYISYLFRQLWFKSKEDVETIIKDYSIHCIIDFFIDYCYKTTTKYCIRNDDGCSLSWR
ncbi:MAG: hypothetical protein COC22_00635, partial [Flavobacteriaceae bacterium]